MSAWSVRTVIVYINRPIYTIILTKPQLWDIRVYIIDSIIHIALSQTGLAGWMQFAFSFLVMLHLQRQVKLHSHKSQDSDRLSQKALRKERKWAFHARCPSIKAYGLRD